MDEEKINEIIDLHYDNAPLIDTNPETTETYAVEDIADKYQEVDRYNADYFISREDENDSKTY